MGETRGWDLVTSLSLEQCLPSSPPHSAPHPMWELFPTGDRGCSCLSHLWEEPLAHLPLTGRNLSAWYLQTSRNEEENMPGSH